MLSNFLAINQGLPLTPIKRKEKKRKKKFSQFGLLFMFMFAKGKEKG
jgi:hypothetical protein